MTGQKKPRIMTSAELGDGDRGTVFDMDDQGLAILTDHIRSWRDEFEDQEGESFELEVVWMTDDEVKALPEL